MAPLYCSVHLIFSLTLGVIFCLTFLLLDGVVDCSALKYPLYQYLYIQYVYIIL